jgi:PPP family 3-phenylpropionic acid transporter
MKETTIKSLTIKCAGLQGIYWMAFCASYSFASVFLLAENFENQQIGFLLALSNIISVFLQPAIGSFVDKTMKISLKSIISYISFINIILLSGLVFVADSIVVKAILYSIILTLTLTVQPLLNSLIFEYINEGKEINYGVTRGIGSISFAFISFILGLLLNRYNPYFLLFVCGGLFTSLLLLIQTLPKTEVQKRQKNLTVHSEVKVASSDFWSFVKKYDRFFTFLLALCFIFIFHTITNTYLVQIMSHLGGGDNDFGLSLTIAAVCELPAMLGFGYLASRFKSGTLLKAAGCFYVVRSLLFLLSTTVLMINFAQLFQGLSFAIYTPASVYYVNELMKIEDKIKGQTFIVGATTLGSVFGSILGGWLLDNVSVSAMLMVGASAAIIGCLLLLYSVKTDIQQSICGEDSSLVSPCDNATGAKD